MNALTEIGCAEVVANHENGKVEVSFDPAVVSLDAIKVEIQELGFDV